MHATYTTIDNIKVRYRQSIKENAPILLMTNAWPQSIRCWDSSWEDLSQHFELLAYDMPGFGLSEGRSELMNPSQQGRFLLKLMDSFNIQQAHGIGPDVGMPVMLWLAENHPDRIHSIITFNGPAFYPPFISYELKAIIKSKGIRQITAYSGLVFAAVAMVRGYKRFKPSAEVLLEYAKFNGSAKKFRLTLDYLSSYPQELKHIGDQLEQIKSPLLLLWGDQDPFIEIKNAHLVSEKVAKCKLQVLKGCGHFSHEDAGSLFVDLVTKWGLGEYQELQ